MNWIFPLIDDTTIVDSDLSVQRCETDKEFFNYVYAHCAIINFSINTAQIEFWCDKAVSHKDYRWDTRGCYCIDNPSVSVLRTIWDRSLISRKYIKLFLSRNKPIPGKTELDMLWAISVVLGGVDEC